MAVFIAPLSADFSGARTHRACPRERKPTSESGSLCQGQPLHWLSIQCDAPHASISLVLSSDGRDNLAHQFNGGHTRELLSLVQSEKLGLQA